MSAAVGDGRVRRAGQHKVEILVRLDDGVVAQVDIDGLADLARSEDQRLKALRLIVGSCDGAAVGGGVVDAHLGRARLVQGDGEAGAGVALVDDAVADADAGRARGPVVVGDGPPTGLTNDGSVDGPEQVQGHVFGVLGRGVVQDRDVDHLGGLAGREGQGPCLGQVVAAVEGRQVRVVVIDGDQVGGRRVEADDELQQAVGLAGRGVGHGDQRRAHGRGVARRDEGAGMGVR